MKPKYLQLILLKNDPNKFLIANKNSLELVEWSEDKGFKVLYRLIFYFIYNIKSF